MKKIILILSIFCLSLVNESNYCDGWEDGYSAGYCYLDPNCIEPIAPLCPIPSVIENTYRDGYNRGFLAGRDAHKK